eukprot:12706408-Alexandrium_andersonii.AAC.1
MGGCPKSSLWPPSLLSGGSAAFSVASRTEPTGPPSCERSRPPIWLRRPATPRTPRPTGACSS